MPTKVGDGSTREKEFTHPDMSARKSGQMGARVKKNSRTLI